MSEIRHYDVFVIGTGPAGATAAVELRKAGLDVGVAEYREYGGTCALRGCNPKKVLSGAAEAVYRCSAMEGKGIDGDTVIDWSSLIAHKNSLLDGIPGYTLEKYHDLGIDTYHGAASFTGRRELTVGEYRIGFDSAVVAAGAGTRHLGVPGENLMIDSTTLLDTESLPEHVLFAGGGYISFEFAHVARAGSRVTIIEALDRPLVPFEPRLVDMLLDISRDAGIEVLTNAPLRSVEKNDDSLTVKFGEDDAVRERSAGLVVLAAGSTAATGLLGLDRAGVECDDGVIVDDAMRSVSNPHVYAAGDVVSGTPRLTPVAEMEARTAIANILSGGAESSDYSGIPAVLFTSPPLGAAGITGNDAKEETPNVLTHFEDTSNSGDTLRFGLPGSGFAMYTDAGGGFLRGAHLLGHDADELINLFAMLIRLKIPLETARDMVWAFPTLGYSVTSMLDPDEFVEY